MGKRKYSDVEKAEALAALKSNGGNIFRTSNELDIPWATLASWAKGEQGINESITDMCDRKADELAVICERVARKYLAQAENPWAISATPGNQAMMTAAIAIDKNRLLLGQSTEIVETQDAVTAALRQHIQRLADAEGIAPLESARQLFQRSSDHPTLGNLAIWPIEFRDQLIVRPAEPLPTEIGDQ